MIRFSIYFWFLLALNPPSAEHTEFGPDVVQELTRACENEDLVPIVRVPKNDVDLVKKCILIDESTHFRLVAFLAYF
jgi:2-keto-3-deoxy-L-rhamnonate aldolase RhmA